MVNVAHALSLRALARLLATAGDPAAQTYAARARRTETALLERCWEPRSGLFLDRAGRSERSVPVSTWSALAPLALGDAVPEAIRLRLAEEHLLDPRRYRAHCGVPSVAMDEPSFRPGFDRFRTWRGPSWVNAAWLLVGGLDALGLRAEGDRIVAGLAAAVARHGFREYYHPQTGAGLGATGFGWSTLIADLVAGRQTAPCAAPG